MDSQAFQLLIDKIDSSKEDLRKDIADLKGTTHQRLDKVETKVQEHERFKWKMVGAMGVLTVLFNGVIAWFREGPGKH